MPDYTAAQLAAARRRVLILCKTYPSPSSRYVETSCVAGMDESGAMVRLYPVPFRLIASDQQFRKWQWIEARIRKAKEDHRPESHRISVDTIEVEGEPLSTANSWFQRRQALVAAQEVFNDFDELERARQQRGVSLALLRPGKLLQLQISKADSSQWSDDEVAKLMQAQSQGHLFDEVAEQRSLKLLKKLPFDFRYVYECSANGVTSAYSHKLVDWEAGALYWNVHRRPDWEAAFRQRFSDVFAERDVYFLMGTIHRFPQQWLIVSVLYLPKQPDDQARQGQLF